MYSCLTYTALGTVQSLSITDSTSTSLSISWGIDRSNPCYTNDVVYVVEYALVNRDQCEEIGFPQRLDYGVVTDTNGVVTNTNVVVSGLFPHSTYEVYVRPRNELANGTVAFVTVTGVTAESGKTLCHGTRCNRVRFGSRVIMTWPLVY